MDTIARPNAVSQDEWLAARKELLAAEKELTRQRDAVNARRRRLPMVRVEKPYVFEGPGGKVGLADLFAGRTLLYIHHFMWRDDLDAGCPSCSRAADRQFNDEHFSAFHERDMSFAAVARAPWENVRAYKEKRGWSFPFYSSHGSDFNYDFHVSLDESKAPIEYNYRSKAELLAAGDPEQYLSGDRPGASVFLRSGDEVYHTYSAYARGLDALTPTYQYLDLTPYGRQEAWEDSPEGWPQAVTSGP